MKKEARERAQAMFLKAGGKITNKEIATAVGVNALTVGRWKRGEKWEAALKRSMRTAKPGGLVIRKKAARDKAEKLFMDLGGNITNKDLARRVDVSPATISKWKELDRWDKILSKAAPAPAPVKAEKKPAPQPEPQPRERLGIDMNELSSPDQIVEINRCIDTLLQREHLTTSEVLELAEAKSELLEAVEKYVSVIRQMKELKLDD